MLSWKRGSIFFLFLILAYTSKSQIVFKVDPVSKMIITGTSTLHDWTSEVTLTKGTISFIADQGKITGISRVSLEIPVESIKNDKSLMNTKTYEALKSDEFPIIRFNVVKLTKFSGNSVTASGTLNIAGKSREIELFVDIVKSGEDKIIVRGEKSLKMSDFGVEPPTALMGTIKTGDEITIKFETTFTTLGKSENVTLGN
ncbi:MAG TPA: YceI family protein [Cyclobacteriaceae bacterium]|nr:YceI family protein [Cyclobacteriaceae bacterium]